MSCKKTGSYLSCKKTGSYLSCKKTGSYLSCKETGVWNQFLSVLHIAAGSRHFTYKFASFKSI